MHGLLTMPYDATDIPESGADQRTGGGRKDHSLAMDFVQFWEKCVDFECLRFKGQFRWQLGDDCANERDGLHGIDVATSRVVFQNAFGLLDALSPINV